MNKYEDCPGIMSEFLFYLETIRNVSPRTVEGYYIDLRTFFRFIKYRRGLVPSDIDFETIEINDVDLALVKSIKTMDIYEFLHFAMTDRDNNANTRARKVSCLRSYFKYLTVKSHKLEENPVKEIEVPAIRKSVPKFLSLEESIRLLDSTEGEFTMRDYCILTLFLNCGMRLSELVGISNSDYNLEDGTIRIIGKGNKERLVYLNGACIDAMKACIKERDSKKYKTKDENALFLSRTGSRIGARRVEQIVDECLARAGLAEKGYSAHKLRHTAATLMYRHGNVDMLALKEILGHAHVSTTEIYTHISDEKLRSAATASPLSRVKKRSTKPEKTEKSDDDTAKDGEADTLE
ncbi:MAG: tyrosine recombinase XerC [Ruminococcaceae bacterium]|nr:tyrosine recombinase XerC [Oscillospiraceae bacterium]